MKISFYSPYKSIRAFPTIEIPDFVVLTGVNGAGKSHFLDALEQGLLRIEEVPFNPSSRSIRRFDSSNLIPNDSGAFSGYQAKQERNQLWNEIKSHVEGLSSLLSNLYSQYPKLAKYNFKQLGFVTETMLLEDGFSEVEATTIFSNIDAATKNLEQNVTQRFLQPDVVNRGRLISAFRTTTNMAFSSMEEEDFHNNFPISWQNVDLFQQSFARLFAEYQENKTRNKFKKFLNSEGGNFFVYSDEEFNSRFGTAPWEFVNNILDSAKLGFTINAPDLLDDRSYEPILTDNFTNNKVKFADLSSGEKILMSFALCLYYANDSRQIVEYPKVLLFDEIDAPLHPSMTQSLLQTIQNVLIKKHNIKVILTTHSPSTVALAPEESLYAMRKAVDDRFKKTTKDSALSILTEGVPTLSLNYENRRQVFTESPYDAELYETIFEKIKLKLIPEISLNFIAAGSSHNGGCAQVSNVVNNLVAAGNKTVFGIIDWDRTNKTSDHVIVMGENQRYSIENYIFDPLLLAALLFQERFIQRSDIGLSPDENHMTFPTMSNERLQRVANFLLENIKRHVASEVNNEGIECKYIGGAAIKIPNWYLEIQGHQLESIIKIAFSDLNRFHRAGDLMRAILVKTIDDLPALIPQCFADAFDKIQRT